MKETVSIDLEKELWAALSKFAHQQSIKKGRRFPTIRALRIAIKVFLKLKPGEINAILTREPLTRGKDAKG